MNKQTLISGISLGLILMLSTMTFTVSETETAILLEFKKIVGTDYTPGLHFKLPYRQVKRFDKRVLTLEFIFNDSPTTEKVVQVVHHGLSPRMLVASFMSRDTKRETASE